MTEKIPGKKFMGFGVEMTRYQAELIFFEEIKINIMGIGDACILESMFFDGWKPISDMSDKDMQRVLDDCTQDENIHVTAKGNVIDPLG